VKDLKVGSWIQINLKKPSVMNGMGIVFAEKVDDLIIKPKGAKIYVKEYLKEALTLADHNEEKKIDKDLNKGAKKNHPL
jgi:hypothetical protein